MPAEQPKKGNVFTRKIGPLPMWVWLIIVGGLIIAYAWYRSQQNQNQAASQNIAGQGDVPEFVGQTFVQTQPPSPPPPPPRKSGHHRRDRDHDDDDKTTRQHHRRGEPPPTADREPPRFPAPMSGSGGKTPVPTPGGYRG
jgi:hypothetical protein